MILEEATRRTFGYSVTDLKPHSNKLIVAECSDCGEVKITTKNLYCALCKSCAAKAWVNATGKGKRKCKCLWCGKEFEVSPNIIKRVGGKYCCKKCINEAHKKIKCVCLTCGKDFEVVLSRFKKGGGKYCCKKCHIEAQYECGRKTSYRRKNAKRKRQLGYTLLLPLRDGEVGHHFTDKDVVGIPKRIHENLSGYSRKKHRTLVLKWLKENNKKKYLKVLYILAKERSRTNLYRRYQTLLTC